MEKDPNLTIFDLKTFESILEVIQEEIEDSESEEEEYESQNEVSLINPNESTNEIFDEILFLSYNICLFIYLFLVYT